MSQQHLRWPPWLNTAAMFWLLTQVGYWLAVACGCAPVNDQAVRPRRFRTKPK